MKKLFLISVVITIIITYSCNQGNKENAQNTSSTKSDTANVTSEKSQDFSFLNCTGVGNYIISETEARSMINTFKDIFRKDRSGADIAYRDSIWVDASVINYFSDTLLLSQRLDGIWFWFVASQDDSSSLVLVPSYNSDGRHYPDWDLKITGMPSNTEFKNFNFDHKKGWPLVKHFGRKYREETQPGNWSTSIRDSVSSAVWMDECAIRYLSEVIKNPGNNLDGIMIYLGAYNKLDNTRHHGQFKAHQSTILFVPTKLIDGQHQSDWTIIQSLVEKIVKNKSDFSTGALNHGQLCPNQCN
jgi:hypothetical protein